LVTKNTTYKKIPLSDINKSIKKIITLSDDDTMLYCGLSNDLEKELIVLYTKNGYGLSVPIDDIGSSKCSSKGRNKFLKELSIDNATIIKRSKYILYVTSYGRLKLTKLSAFPILGEGHSIKDGLLKITSFDIDNDELLSIYGVDKPKKTTLVTFSKKNNPQETPVSEVPILNRQQCGDKMISVKNKDIIVDTALIN
jgi:DNA gyrase/topoisomerase IV subunit A